MARDEYPGKFSYYSFQVKRFHVVPKAAMLTNWGGGQLSSATNSPDPVSLALDHTGTLGNTCASLISSACSTLNPQMRGTLVQQDLVAPRALPLQEMEPLKI